MSNLVIKYLEHILLYFKFYNAAVFEPNLQFFFYIIQYHHITLDNKDYLVQAQKEEDGNNV